MPGQEADDAIGRLAGALMWGLPLRAIHEALETADGDELGSGKILSPTSSAALAINAFAPFLEHPEALPPLPGTEDLGWPARSVRIEAILPFPWRGGRRPNMDVLIETGGGLIGIESKRYEPFGSHRDPDWSDAYWRPVWGEAMDRHQALRDRSRTGDAGFKHLEEAQLLKHALGLLTATAKVSADGACSPCLVHLRAQPRRDRRGREIDLVTHDAVSAEVARFGEAVVGDHVRFVGLTYRRMIEGWRAAPLPQLRAHAAALLSFFDDEL
jgi:hypothetical protein